ncbi:MAG: outer membrane lipoprotein carrier protein LolA [Proteobacteria bacterium]|nr:outer membrane lipoprotein carrier protein LolA [Pseudomonadota bacterium]
MIREIVQGNTSHQHAVPAKGRAGNRPRRLAAIVIVALAWAAAVPAAAEPPRAATLSAADRADIGRIEAYLNRIGTLKARFLQVSSTGELSEGTLFISRPGKLRIEYDPPVPILIVASRGVLTYFDKELEQVSEIDLDSTPAGILVGENISFFSGDFTLTRFKRQADVARVTLVRTEDPQEGSLTLIFSDRPLTLRKWIVTDAQGVKTTVSLLKTRFGLPLNPELFTFEAPEPPEGGD